MTEPRGRAHRDARAVGAAVGERGRHGVEHRARHRAAVGVQETGYAAHRWPASLRGIVRRPGWRTVRARDTLTAVRLPERCPLP